MPSAPEPCNVATAETAPRDTRGDDRAALSCDAEPASGAPSDPPFGFADERTFLARNRSALAVIGSGPAGTVPACERAAIASSVAVAALRVASRHNVSLRTGCFCNPGVGEVAFTISRETRVGGEFGDGMMIELYDTDRGAARTLTRHSRCGWRGSWPGRSTAGERAGRQTRCDSRRGSGGNVDRHQGVLGQPPTLSASATHQPVSAGL